MSRIARLLQKKLVTRKESEGDRRFQDIKLTAQATSLIPKLAALADKKDEQFFSSLSNTQQEQLTKLLKQLAMTHKLKKTPID